MRSLHPRRTAGSIGESERALPKDAGLGADDLDLRDFIRAETTRVIVTMCVANAVLALLVAVMALLT